MKLYLSVFFIFFTQLIFPQSNALQVKIRIYSLLTDKFFDTTLAAVDVYDLTLNESLYSRNENFLLRPASNMKILTTSAALLFLGPAYNFTTSICYTGEIKNDTLYGDLYVIGGCDPDFSYKDLDSLAGVIKSAGINEIKGNLIGDVSMMDSLYWGKGWMWDDDCALLTPLDINSNLIGAIVKPGIIGQKADVQLIPQTDFVKFDNSSVTVPADSSNTYNFNKDWINHTNTLMLKGNVSARVIPDLLQDTLHTHVYEPQLYFLSLFKKALSNSGINLSGKQYISVTPPYAHNLYSFKRPFGNIITYLNKESYNLGAEMTLRALAAKYFGKPATAENGIKMIDSLVTLSGLRAANYRLVDGSGLSHYNLVSAQLLLEVLKYMYFRKPELFNILFNSFPIAGVDGTLSERMRGTSAQYKVHAKTGTLSGVSSISGYVNARNGHLLAFSILLQGFSGSATESRAYEDKICNILAEYK